MRYVVTVQEFTPAGETYSRDTWHYFDGLRIKEAWQIVERHARRGFNRHGGTIARHNWGARGGVFPHSYRSAVIKLDV
jgi:hypothetical protein